MESVPRALPVYVFLRNRSPAWPEGRPLVLAADGEPPTHRMNEVRVDGDDILAIGRAPQGFKGFKRLDQIKHAVLERNGDISMIPRERQ